MNHIQGLDRNQMVLFPEAVEDYVTAENPARFLEAFVEKLNLVALGFKSSVVQPTGRPPYHPADLLKLYLYGYLFKIRSSRKLEREAQRNVELMWLMKKLTPDYKTIANFRKIEILNERKEFFEETKEELEESGESQMSLTDPDSRSMVFGKGCEVGFNVQTAVDSKHHLIVDHEVTNHPTDQNELYPIHRQ